MDTDRTSAGLHAADLVIITRVALAFVAIGLLSRSVYWAAAGVGLTIVVIVMDGLDGYVARKLGVDDDLGAVLDITGDRIVEHVYWIYFAVAGVIPLWVPLVVVTRSFAVDTVRGLAFNCGKTAFGEKSMMQSRLSRFLVSSRFMRTAYAVAKVAAFILLGLVIVAGRFSADAAPFPDAAFRALEVTAFVVVVVAVALNLLRGIPVLLDSRPYLQRGRSEA
ncbi:MAG: CDP-alcohol phosphatidyltransferase family protein [Gemmatimonadota bacterium]|nr:CDP-alcohol phosphatidyltransferase family protein [Gemmatimonadota bacterium]